MQKHVFRGVTLIALLAMVLAGLYYSDSSTYNCTSGCSSYDCTTGGSYGGPGPDYARCY